ncbi:MAG: hypothetical protein Q4E72_01705, partial [bacterium]|nr:hypothetical protein [bacterium]
VSFRFLLALFYSELCNSPSFGMGGQVGRAPPRLAHPVHRCYQTSAIAPAHLTLARSLAASLTRAKDWHALSVLYSWKQQQKLDHPSRQSHSDDVFPI